MAFFNIHTATVQPDRRVARRYLVDCPARLVMAGGDREGRLSDLSEHGARLDTAQPPMGGATGFLRWGSEEHYCKVIWSKKGCCGLRFDRPIALAVVEATCSHVEVSLKPIASVSRIPLGARRAHRLTTEAPD